MYTFDINRLGQLRQQFSHPSRLFAEGLVEGLQHVPVVQRHQDQQNNQDNDLHIRGIDSPSMIMKVTHVFICTPVEPFMPQKAYLDTHQTGVGSQHLVQSVVGQSVNALIDACRASHSYEQDIAVVDADVSYRQSSKCKSTGGICVEESL